MLRTWCLERTQELLGDILVIKNIFIASSLKCVTFNSIWEFSLRWVFPSLYIHMLLRNNHWLLGVKK